MKRIFFNYLLCALVACVLTGCGDSDNAGAIAPPIGTETPSNIAKIAVLAHTDFLPDRTEAQAGVLIGLPSDLADRIIEHLTNSKRFTPVERTALRKLVLEQRFGKDLANTYLDRTVDKAISAMEEVNGVTVGVTGSLANYNDVLKDFQDLGSAAGADYLVLGDLEKLSQTSQVTAVPYSNEGRVVQKNVTDARLRLRVIDVRSGTVVGATSIRTQVEEALFEGKESTTDQYSFYDHLGQMAARKVLDVTFPAKIVSVDPLVISRGINDGAKNGDFYLVKREGKQIKDSNGTVIARLKSDVGQVEIVEVQETVSVVKAVSGGALVQGDLAYLDTESNDSPARVASSAEVPLTGRNGDGAMTGKLPRLAVALIKSGSTESKGKEAEQNTPIFTDTLISRLTQTKRFQVIDRQEVDQLLTEQLAQALVENRNMPSAMGSLKGADYLVYGSLASFSVEDKVTQLPGSSRTFTSKVGYVEGNMRIVDARSGDILESRKVSVKEKVDSGADGSRIVTALADAYAEEVVMLLMNAIYPIKVAAVSGDGTVYINRGEDGGLHVGETLDAFRPGPPILDPDTGVKLGVEETVIGQVAVTEVEDARSKGKVTVEGASLAVGDILKRGINTRASQSVANSAPEKSGGSLPGGAQEDNPKAGSRFTLAVGTLYLNPASRSNNGFGQGHIKRMSDDIALKLTNTNRFVVMDRQEIDQILDEKAFEAAVKGGDIQDRLRELAGADYLIHGEIANFYTTTERSKVPYVEEEQVKTTGVAEGMFRIVDVHTGAVVGADKIRHSVKINNSNDSTQIMSNMMDAFTTKAVGAVVLRLFPIKVMGVAGDGIVYLNRGEDAGLMQGAMYDVMRPGEVLKDPDTGISFGNAEIKVATVKLQAVEANRSRASLVTGSDARSGDILRKAEAQMDSKPKPQAKTPSW